MYLLIIVCIILILYKFTIHSRYVGGDPDDEKIIARVRALSRYNNKSVAPFYSPSAIKGDIPYSAGDGLLLLGCSHWTRQSLMSDIQFLTIANTKLVIYFGSAIGEHIPVLRNLFPSVKFLLIDSDYHVLDIEHVYVYQNPKAVRAADQTRYNMKAKDPKSRYYNAIMKYTPSRLYKTNQPVNLIKATDPNNVEYDVAEVACNNFYRDKYLDLFTDMINGTHMIYVIQDRVTTKLLELLHKSLDRSKLKNFSLISSLKSMYISKRETDIDYIWTEAIQLTAVKLLRPEFSVINFKPPYYNINDAPAVLAADTNPALSELYIDIKYVKDNYDLDMIAGYKQKHYLYLDSSDILLKPWSRRTSDHARLLITKYDIDKPYHYYEENDWSMKYVHLNLIRNHVYFGDLYSIIKKCAGNIYDGCFDCMLELLILSYYFNPRRTAKYLGIDIKHAISTFKLCAPKIADLNDMIYSYILPRSIMPCSFHNLLTKIPKRIYLHVTRKISQYEYCIYALEEKREIPVMYVHVSYDDGKYTVTYDKVEKLSVASNLDDITNEKTLTMLANNVCQALRLDIQ